VIRKGFTKNGVPEAALRVEVTEGPFQGQGFIDSWYLAAGRTQAVTDDKGALVKDNEGNIQREAVSDKDFADRMRKSQGRIKTIRASVFKLPASVTPSVPSTDDDFLFQFYDIDGLVGREHMGEVKVDKESGRNSFLNRFPMDHKEFGLAAWRAKELPRQLKTAGAGKAGGGAIAKAQEI
jgi:hypothetical protein